MSTFEFYDIANYQVIKICLSFRLRYKEDCLELYFIVRVYIMMLYIRLMVMDIGRFCLEDNVKRGIHNSNLESDYIRIDLPYGFH